jgi:hypothetical protein
MGLGGFAGTEIKGVAGALDEASQLAKGVEAGSDAVKVGFPNLGKVVSAQKQARHLAGTAGEEQGFLNNINDAQSVLDAVYSGEAQFIGTSKAGHNVSRFDRVTGTNVNLGAGIVEQPTNIFMIKGMVQLLGKVVPCYHEDKKRDYGEENAVRSVFLHVIDPCFKKTNVARVTGNVSFFIIIQTIPDGSVCLERQKENNKKGAS